MQQAAQSEYQPQNPNEVIEYSYRPSLLLLAVFFSVSLAGTCVLFQHALTNNRGMVIKRTIHLGVEAATWLIWGMDIFFLCMALYVGKGLFRSLFVKQKLTLSHDLLSFPVESTSGIMTEIRLAGIEAMEIKTEYKMTSLAIWHANGYNEVHKSNFPGKGAFESFVSAIYERAPAL